LFTSANHLGSSDNSPSSTSLRALSILIDKQSERDADRSGRYLSRY
jgi:hypothetical protein